MEAKQWYEALFENYGQKYESEKFVGGTVGECDFIEQELSYDKTLRILDVGCGTGRHSIELAKRGYTVTGIDLSQSLLSKAIEKANQDNLPVTFLHHDARHLPFNAEFDAAIMLCEGGFPLMETDEMNYLILQNVTRSLTGSAKFIFTTLNGLYPLFHSVDAFHKDNNTKADVATYHNSRFDLMTFREYKTIEVEDDLSDKKTLQCNERFYVPSEITWLLKSLGFKNIDIFGAKLGAFSRNDILATNDFEMLIVAEK